MLPKQDLPGILLGLGTSKDEVAATLKRSKIRGVRNTVRHLNPIVRYVQQQILIDDYQLYLEQSTVNGEMILRFELPDGESDETLIAGAVKEFLNRFNRGEYSDLELPAG
jgi:hypothetical protein